MADMGMAHGDMAGMDMGGMDHTGMDMPGMAQPPTPAAPPADTAGMAGHAGHDMGAMPGMSMPGMGMGGTAGTDAATLAVAGAIRTQGLRAPGTLPTMLEHEADTHGPGNAAVPMMVQSRLAEPGIGLGDDGWRVLLYTDLRALKPRETFRAPDREIELHLTGNMERFMWSIDGVPFEDSEPIPFTYGERLRLTMVNDTMMNHPMHLHGMWMELENGHGELIPRVHTVNVKPAERLSLLIDVDAPGMWAFHCHVLYHMEVGMFRVVRVSQPGEGTGMPGHDHHEG
jgi:FtsP/CotA-like multicopper oxidase with cupredoxin domain